MSSNNFVPKTENAKIYKLELCNDKGQIVTNEAYQWDSAQDKDMTFKIGAKVPEKQPTDDNMPNNSCKCSKT